MSGTWENAVGSPYFPPLTLPALSLSSFTHFKSSAAVLLAGWGPLWDNLAKLTMFSKGGKSKLFLGMPGSLFCPWSFTNRSKKSAAWWSSKSRSVRVRQRFKFRLRHALAVLTLASGFPSVKWGQSHLLTGYCLKPQVDKVLCLVPGTESGYQWQVIVISITWWCPLTHPPVGPCSSRPPLSKDSERWASPSSGFPGIFISVQAIHSTIIRLFIQ